MLKENCKNCQYVVTVENGFAECRINPPVITPGSSKYEDGRWPIVCICSCCGKFEPERKYQFCQNCYYYRSEGRTDGYCERQAPGTSKAMFYCPDPDRIDEAWENQITERLQAGCRKTQPSDWCGEYKSRCQ
jgi:hypothetical protein